MYVALPTLLSKVSFLVPYMHMYTHHSNTDNGPTTHGVPRERLSAAMLPQFPLMDYDIIFPKDKLDKANKDKKRYPGVKCVHIQFCGTMDQWIVCLQDPMVAVSQYLISHSLAPT